MGNKNARKHDAYAAGEGGPADLRVRITDLAASRQGCNHPLIKPQYYLEEIDATGGLFSALRRALMRGDHERRHEPFPSRRYAFLVDVASEAEAEGDATSRLLMANRKWDAAAFTVVDVATYYGQLPTCRAVDRRLWLGVEHATLYGKILALAYH